jgi:hypothetical protein
LPAGIRVKTDFAMSAKYHKKNIEKLKAYYVKLESDKKEAVRVQPKPPASK